MRYMFFLGFLFIWINLNAQYFLGVNSGLTYSWISNKNDFPGDFDKIWGYSIGLDIEYYFNSKISFESNIGYFQNGYSLKMKHFFSDFDLQSSKSYLGFAQSIRQENLLNSWLLGYNFGDKLNYQILMGYYWSYLIQARSSLKNYQFVDSSEANILSTTDIGYHEYQSSGFYNIDSYTRFDFGFCGGFRLGYSISSHYEIVFNSRFYRGMINSNKNLKSIGTKRFNNSINLTVGYIIKI